MSERDPNEAIDDVADERAEGEAPSEEEREFLHGEGVERGGPDDGEPSREELADDARS
jgi:hypothetical protein